MFYEKCSHAEGGRTFQYGGGDWCYQAKEWLAGLPGAKRGGEEFSPVGFGEILALLTLWFLSSSTQNYK